MVRTKHFLITLSLCIGALLLAVVCSVFSNTHSETVELQAGVVFGVPQDAYGVKKQVLDNHNIGRDAFIAKVRNAEVPVIEETVVVETTEVFPVPVEEYAFPTEVVVPPFVMTEPIIVTEPITQPITSPDTSFGTTSVTTGGVSEATTTST